jgi:hypothetical protein
MDVETAVAPRDSLARDLSMEGVKGLCRFLLLVEMQTVEWPESQGNAQILYVNYMGKARTLFKERKGRARHLSITEETQGIQFLGP